MKGRLVALVGVFCIALLIVSGAYAGKPDKKGKPPRPGNIAVECIEFTGDLQGGQVVEGCCPNAGPFPAYSMTLATGSELDGTYEEGHLFAKPVRTRVNRQWITRYKVQFSTWDWFTETPGIGDYFFEIYSDGDDIVYDETTSLLTVTVTDATATGWVYYDMNCDPCDPDCDPCPGVNPTCDDLCDPDCPYPCNEEISIEDVSFILNKTSDLTYCED